MKFIAALLLSVLSGCLHQDTIKQGISPSQLRAVASMTVMILTEDGQGSGSIIWSDNGRMFILTCEHVTRGSTEVTIQSPYLGELTGTVLKSSVEEDLAIIFVYAPERHLQALPIATEESKLYESLYTLTSPVGVFGTASQSYLISKNTPLQLPNRESNTVWTISSGFTLPGSSGGAIVNSLGQLECVLEAGIAPFGPPLEELGFCIGLPEIRDFVKGYAL